MKYVGFILVVALYVYVCYLGIRGYWLIAGYLHQKFHAPVTRTVLLHGWFLIFVIVEVPISIFFPAWLSGRWGIFAPEPRTTALLLLFGCATLALAAWRGWRGAEARRFSNMLRK
jgi:hypothetical protein